MIAFYESDIKLGMWKQRGKKWLKETRTMEAYVHYTSKISSREISSIITDSPDDSSET